MTESIYAFSTRLFLVEFHADISVFFQIKEIFREISWKFVCVWRRQKWNFVVIMFP